MGELVVHGRRDHGTVVIDVEGDLDPVSARTLQGAVLAQHARDGGCVVVNLAKVSSCDPAGLSVLITVKRAVIAVGSRFVLVAPSYPVARALRVTGIARNLRICSTLEAACRQPGIAGVPRQRSGVGEPVHEVAERRGDSTASARG